MINVYAYTYCTYTHDKSYSFKSNPSISIEPSTLKLTTVPFTSITYNNLEQYGYICMYCMCQQATTTSRGCSLPCAGL